MYQGWRKKIELLSQEVLMQNNLLKIPIDVEKLAEKLKLKVIRHRFEGDVSGVLTIKNGKGTIGVNRKHSPVRIRFTIAHEIGHYLLNHQRTGELFVDKNTNEFVATMFRNADSATGDIQQEREANAFAAALLMPSILIKKEIKRYSFDMTDEKDTDLDRLSSDFKVSSQAMAIRLSTLGYLSL